MGAAFQKMLDSLYTKKLEVVLVGLENAGKTTLLSVLSSGAPEDTVPTVGLDVKLIRRGGLQLKCWDIGGQAQYRAEWGRYTRGCDVIIFVVDVHARDSVGLAKQELHRLLEDPQLATTPLLVCANKVDLHPHISEKELIRALNLDYITENPWVVIPVSALEVTNVDQVVTWLQRQNAKAAN
mmetsp:Transcript_24836/g.55949  ORF Transcript_24836/g.55949 Transcript_24836/m.55949 type:complete len:182 (+) Transcript_24836:389-934(+)|eukprot:CAMPEP_0172587264 /NCGR_PEP_ID=MMETSP1068-20121228/6344_1 /TAXON_ID=35684 /ORGANISM="Pseudopedinella elastica, Strain CCMP716" /LENGTH=181 /DNA_ID=CAMNT_0013382223 /DNA_START=296 /DNA_END=841 /DNA_ORIENTATION=-